MKKTILLIISILILNSCSSSKRASYYSTQHSIEHGDFDFANSLRVDEYINAFEQPNIKSPTKADINLNIDYFYNQLPAEQKTTLAQISIRTRKSNEAERKKKLALSIVLDISGSMGGTLIRDSKKALIEAVKEMKAGTELSIVLFDDEAEVLVPKTSINQEEKIKIIAKLEKVDARGGTNIEAGLVLGYKQLSEFNKDAISRLFLITDGQSNVGITDPNEIAKKAKVGYVTGGRISTMGLGGGVDEELLRKIAKDGKGHYYFSDKASTLTKFLREDLKSTMIPIAKNGVLRVEANRGFKLKTIYGYEKFIKNNYAEIPYSELNVDDWRIMIAEVEVTIPKASSKPLSTSFSYSTLKNAKKKLYKSPTINWNSKSKPEINKTVARNSVLFSNAMALKKISSLSGEGKINEAMELADLQLVNIKVAKKWDDSKMFANEEQTFLKVKKGLNRKAESSDVAIKSQPKNQKNPFEGDSTKGVIKAGLSVVKKVAPGPWTLVFSLFELLL